MQTLRFYIHPECERCRRLSHFHRRFDRLQRIEHTTRTPASGELRPGQVAAEDIASGEYFHGYRALQALCRSIPLYRIFLPLFWLKPVQRKLDRQLSGCGGTGCKIS